MRGAGGPGAARYRDREHAGQVLADELIDALADRPTPPGLIVLGLPRGGVPVAAPVAARLAAALGVLVVRKITTPERPELALGAVAAIGERVETVRNEQVLSALGVSDGEFARARERQLPALVGGADRFGATPDPRDRPVVVVDDGLATGATVRAAVGLLRGAGAAWIAGAVPVGAARALEDLGRLADLVVCPLVPADFVAVGQAYDDFTQVPDTSVVALLDEHRGRTQNRR